MPRAAPLPTVLLLACAHVPPPIRADPDLWESYRIDLRGTFETSPTVPELEPLESVSVDLDLLVELRVVEVKTDGSIQRQVRFAEASASTTSSGGPGAPAPLDLEGRSFLLRTFPNGEVLTVEQAEHVSGPDRYLDVFDLLVPILSPSPPSLDDNASASRAVRWPLVVSPEQRIRGFVDATWTHAGMAQVAGATAWHFTYAGPWTTRGGDRQTSVAARGDGSAAGEVWLREGDGALLAHDFDWQRSMVLQYGSGRIVTQQQQFKGHLERVP